MTKAIRFMIVVLSLTLLSIGVDYVTGNTVDLGRPFGDELLMPTVWGWTAIAVSAAGLFSAHCNRPSVAKIIALTAGSVYIMFAIQIYQPHMLPIPWPPEDHRMMTNHLGMAFIWYVLAITIFWRNIVEERREELVRMGLVKSE